VAIAGQPTISAAMDYQVIKLIHQSTVALSFFGFLARGLGVLVDSAWVRSRAARTLPHIVDTILLLSGVTLAWLQRLSPVSTPWLLAKLIGLVIYVALGMVALRGGRTKLSRAIAWIVALVVFGYIVSVAVTKEPLGFLAAVRV
jgi:uncharacterized membrane protein SirB2